MKKVMKKALATFLAIVMISGTFVCFAAELNQDAVNLHYGQFENYVLLGDSVACGYRDEVLDGDADFNEANNETTYFRVPGSYADVLTKAIIDEANGGTMTALAGPGFRTIEMRYMLEDEFAASFENPEEDPFLFRPSHLYVYEDQVCACHGVNLTPGSEHFRDAFKESISKADLITLGVGGNDWGAFLGWFVTDIFKEEHVGDQYIADAKEILDKSTMNKDTVAQLVDLAHKAGALPRLIEEVPQALNEALMTFYSNWDIMIQDIYDLNPDVTLMVVGMSDNSLKGKYYDYNGVIGEPVNPDAADEDPTKAAATKFIIDFIMGVGNEPMIKGAEKFGYKYVDTDGTTYVDSHPDADGHIFIANKIIEALPDPVISKQYKDIVNHKYYNAIEYVLINNIMEPLTDTTFGPDSSLKTYELTQALNPIKGTDKTSDSDKSVTAIKLALEILGCATTKDTAGFFKTIALSLSVIADCNFNVGNLVTRGQAADYLMTLYEI